jgi:hypothetical protein
MNFVILSVKTGIGEDNTRDLEDEGRGRTRENKREEEKRKRTYTQITNLAMQLPKSSNMLNQILSTHIT